MRFAIVTSAESWYYPHAVRLTSELESNESTCPVLTDHRELDGPYEIVFYLSYFRLVGSDVLSRNRHNIVVHESDLPKGRGWAPLFWQVIEGKNEIPVVAFEAVEEMDAGRIYVREQLRLDGTELHDELRVKQAQMTRDLVLECVRRYRRGELCSMPQTGEPSYYPKRTPADSELDPSKPIEEQFDLLRTVNSADFPAFFDLRGCRYVLSIRKAGEELQ